MEENKTYTKEEISQVINKSLSKFPVDSVLVKVLEDEISEQLEKLDNPEPNDLVTTTPDDWTPTEYVVSVTCPHCGKYDDTYRSDIPSEVVVTCSHCHKSYRIYCGW